MTKPELIEAIADHADITKKDAAKALDGFVDAITRAMSIGQDVTLQGFGTFAVKTREARTGRNPQTGAAIEIPASQYVAFKAGKALKEAVN